MPKPLTIQFGPWLPDQATLPVPISSAAQELPLADCLNVIYSNGNYQSLPTAAWAAASLPAQCLGAFTAIDQNGNPQIYAGTQSNLYHWTGSAWSEVDGGTNYFAASWSFAQFGSNVIATYTPPDSPAPIATWLNTVGARTLTIPIGGNAFSAISGAPAGSVCGVINQFAVVGDIWSDPGYTNIGTGNGTTTTFTTTLANIPVAPFYVYAGVFTTSGGAVVTAANDDGAGNFSTTGLTGTLDYSTGALSLTFTTAPTTLQTVKIFYMQANPYRVQWSAIGDQTNWPTPLTNAALAAESGYEDLTPDFGAVQFIAGFPQFGIVLQRFGITRMSYVGGDVVFSFSPYEKTHGAVSSLAAVPVDEVVYFVSDEGFYVTDGSSVSPIGSADASGNTMGIDQWFKNNVNQAALSSISGGYDANTRCIHFAVPTGTNTLPDTLLIYNPTAQRWTRGAQTSELVFSDNSGSKRQLGLLSTTHNYGTLSGAPQTGYVETVDMMFVDGMTRLTTGVRPLIASIDTPTARIGTHKSANDPVHYTHDVSREPFTRICPLFAQGYFQRVRVSSKNAQAINGATLYLETGGQF